MKKSSRRLWFRAKSFGWGWYPATWEGWVITTLYIVIYTLGGIVFGAFAPAVLTAGGSVLPGILLFFSLMTLVTASLLALCYRYGENPHWRWGTTTKRP